MPRHQHPITIKYGEVKELTDSDVTAIKFQVLEGRVEIRRGSVLPEADARGFSYGEIFGERFVTLDGLSAANGARVYAIGKAYPESLVIVDHA